MSGSVYDEVIGQERAVDVLRALAESPAHAYLFVGPPGCGKDVAARAFATVKLQHEEDAGSRVARLVMRGEHVDVHEVIREGASISIEQARDEIIAISGLSAVESPRRVTIVHEFQLMEPRYVPTLLKTLEEPDAQNVIVLLADEVPAHLITIESRCVRVDFSAISDQLIVDILLSEGVMPTVAESVAGMVAGDLARARILVDDHRLIDRMRLFAEVPARVDGNAATALALTSEIVTGIDEALEPYKRAHERELDELEERERTLGVRGSGRSKITKRHSRELRRARTDEIRSGLRIISRLYADALRDANDQTAHHQVDGYLQAVARIRDANIALGLNANESLLLQNLFLSLPAIHD
jgi:DNA polymerase-3 subunit delta'